MRREKIFADRVREESVNRKVVPLEDIARHPRNRQPALRRRHPLLPHHRPPAPLFLQFGFYSSATSSPSAIVPPLAIVAYAPRFCAASRTIVRSTDGSFFIPG